MPGSHNDPALWSIDQAMLRRRKTQRKRAYSDLKSSREEFDPDGDHRSYVIEQAKAVPPELFLVPIIDTTLVQCARDGESPFEPAPRDGGKRARYVIHPSQLGGCTRKAFFTFVHAQEDNVQPSAVQQRWFGTGHSGHRRVQGYLFEAWRRKVGGVTRVWEDVKLAIPELCISGELDSIVEIAHKYRYVMEFKTSGKAPYQQLRKAKEEWDVQDHVYMKAVGLKGGVVLVECKDNQNMREFQIPFKDGKWERIEERCHLLIHTAKGSVVPKDKDESGCFFCSYKTTCADTKGRIDWEKVDEKVEWPS